MKTITPCPENTITEMLSQFWMPHLIACEDIFEHLEYVDQSMKDIRKKALKKNLQEFDDLISRDIPSGWRFKEYRRRTIITLSGKITYLRRIYTEPSGICHAYLDEVLGIRTRRQLAPDAFLWVAKTAADLSFRNTAKTFFERTGAKISHWLVMSVVREEGALILRELYDEIAREKKGIEPTGTRYSQETLYVEFDGVHIPLQKSFHEPLKPRWQYESERQKHSFELKSAVAYAGKDKKRRRVGVVHLALDEQPEAFWPLLSARIAQDYDPEDVAVLNASSDLAGWCKNHALAEGFPSAHINHYLDPYHVNREVKRAFGSTKQASHMISLIYARKTKRLVRDLSRVIASAKKGKERKKYLKLLDYLQNSMEMLRLGVRNNMGTMEGTNAHVYAARMKVWGGGWSREGAQAMALIRARLASGKELITPTPDNVFFSDEQTRRRHHFEKRASLKSTWTPKESAGQGWEPPQGKVALTTHLPSRYYGLLVHPLNLN